MRYGIIADIHGNLEALEAVIGACQQDGVRRYFCAGDIVGYGADPSACIEKVLELNAECIAGNHDWGVTGKVSVDRFNPAAQAAVAWTQNQLSTDEMKYLNNLELTYSNKDLVMVHGTLNKPETFQYLTDMTLASDTFYLMQQPVCFLGHTHVPQIYVKEDDKVNFADVQYAEIKENQNYIVNVGSVGQPRDGNALASYAIYDPDLERVEIKRTSYDIEKAQKKILNAGLPEVLARRLSIGQ